jgi:hypothetical protein
VRESEEEEGSGCKADELYSRKGLEASRRTGSLFTSLEVL